MTCLSQSVTKSKKQDLKVCLVLTFIFVVVVVVLLGIKRRAFYCQASSTTELRHQSLKSIFFPFVYVCVSAVCLFLGIEPRALAW